MTSHENDLLRRLEGFRRDDILNGIVLATSRIGGAGAVLAAITEAQSERNSRVAKQRHHASRRRSPAQAVTS
jgi:hypothetical protein